MEDARQLQTETTETQTQNTKPNKTEKLGEAPKIEPNFEIDNVQHEKHRA